MEQNTFCVSSFWAPPVAVQHQAAGPTKPAAARAREEAGFDLKTAARRARVTPDYLRSVEKNGAPFALACRLSHLYGGVPIDLFLKRKETDGKRTRSSGDSKPSPGRRHPDRA